MSKEEQMPSAKPEAGKPVYVTFVNAGGLNTQTFTKGEADAEGLLGDQAYNLVPAPQHRGHLGGGRHCPACGFSQKDFEQRGRFGCPSCYQAFQDVLPRILKKMHKGPCHVGKVPRGNRDMEVLRNRLKYLEKEMADAIRSERFEDAAVMRDQIREIQGIAAEPETPGP